MIISTIIIIVRKLLILQLQNASLSQELQELLGSDEYDFCYDLGIGQPVNTIRLEDRERIISSIANHYGILVVINTRCTETYMWECATNEVTLHLLRTSSTQSRRYIWLVYPLWVQTGEKRRRQLWCCGANFCSSLKVCVQANNSYIHQLEQHDYLLDVTVLFNFNNLVAKQHLLNIFVSNPYLCDLPQSE